MPPELEGRCLCSLTQIPALSLLQKVPLLCRRQGQALDSKAAPEV